MKKHSLLLSAATAACLASGALALDAITTIRDSGIPGGICVILGDKDGTMTADAGRDTRFTVQALCADRGEQETIRDTIRKAGCYGRVSATPFTGGALPYTDNLINLVIVRNREWLAKNGITAAELMRVVAPGGRAVVEGETTTKPWPDEIDQWTHFLHGPDGNPVAEDTVAGPPRHFQWVGGPKWAQSHETDTSLRCLISANGRIYYILNEAPTSLAGPDSPPDKWSLQARDAFNGVPLWKIPVKAWGWRQWKPSWFTPRPGVIPLNLDKRIAANGDLVYFTLGYRAPVSEIDGRTGKLLRTFAGTERATELLCTGDSLILTALDAEKGPVVKRLDLASGKLLWTSAGSYAGTTVDYYRFTEMGGEVEPAKVDPTLDIAVDSGTIALVDGDSVAALDYATGEQRWRTKFPLAKEDLNAGRINNQAGNVWNGAMIVAGEVVLHASPNMLAAFSAQTGKVLWQQPKKYLQHLWYEWQDVFVIDGLVWTWSSELKNEKLAGNKGGSSWPVSVNGYNLQSGRLEKSIDLGNTFKTHHHHRCYRNKATSKYILSSRRGSEFINLTGGEHSVNNWVRGACHMGMMPANGMHYAPPHPCQCYANEMLNGINALTSTRGDAVIATLKELAPHRLAKGPGYDTATPGPEAVPGTDWPIFRADARRSGSTAAALPADMEQLWQVKAGSKASAPVSADGKLFVALVDEHQVLALSAGNGRELWRFTANARVDSAPTYDRGALVFGCADGRVLVDAGIAYFAAGRSSHTDNGIRMIAADAATGRVLQEQILAGPAYDGNTIEQNFGLPMGWVADMLFTEGNFICMRIFRFDRNMQLQKGQPALQVGSGFLDDTWFKRKPWSVGASGFARSVVFEDETAYCLRMFDSLKALDPKIYFTPGAKGYLLYSAKTADGKRAWEKRVPIRGKALAVAGNLLCVAGPPDLVPDDDPLGAFEGRLGGVLRLVEKTNGETLAEHQLPSPPVFNGAAIAGSRLFLSLEDGGVVCFGKK